MELAQFHSEEYIDFLAKVCDSELCGSRYLHTYTWHRLLCGSQQYISIHGKQVGACPTAYSITVVFGVVEPWVAGWSLHTCLFGTCYLPGFSVQRT